MKYVWYVIGIIFTSWSVILFVMILGSPHTGIDDIESLIFLLSVGIGLFSLSLGNLYKKTTILQEEIDDLRVRIKERDL